MGVGVIGRLKVVGQEALGGGVVERIRELKLGLVMNHDERLKGLWL